MTDNPREKNPKKIPSNGGFSSKESYHLFKNAKKELDSVSNISDRMNSLSQPTKKSSQTDRVQFTQIYTSLEGVSNNMKKIVNMYEAYDQRFNSLIHELCDPTKKLDIDTKLLEDAFKYANILVKYIDILKKKIKNQDFNAFTKDSMLKLTQKRKILDLKTSNHATSQYKESKESARKIETGINEFNESEKKIKEASSLIVDVRIEQCKADIFQPLLRVHQMYSTCEEHLGKILNDVLDLDHERQIITTMIDLFNNETILPTAQTNAQQKFRQIETNRSDLINLIKESIGQQLQQEIQGLKNLVDNKKPRLLEMASSRLSEIPWMKAERAKEELTVFVQKAGEFWLGNEETLQEKFPTQWLKFVQLIDTLFNKLADPKLLAPSSDLDQVSQALSDDKTRLATMWKGFSSDYNLERSEKDQSQADQLCEIYTNASDFYWDNEEQHYDKVKEINEKFPLHVDLFLRSQAKYVEKVLIDANDRIDAWNESKRRIEESQDLATYIDTLSNTMDEYKASLNILDKGIFTPTDECSFPPPYQPISSKMQKEVIQSAVIKLNWALQGHQQLWDQAWSETTSGNTEPPEIIELAKRLWEKGQFGPDEKEMISNRQNLSEDESQKIMTIFSQCLEKLDLLLTQNTPKRSIPNEFFSKNYGNDDRGIDLSQPNQEELRQMHEEGKEPKLYSEVKDYRDQDTGNFFSRKELNAMINLYNDSYIIGFTRREYSDASKGINTNEATREDLARFRGDVRMQLAQDRWERKQQAWISANAELGSSQPPLFKSDRINIEYQKKMEDGKEAYVAIMREEGRYEPEQDALIQPMTLANALWHVGDFTPMQKQLLKKIGGLPPENCQEVFDIYSKCLRIFNDDRSFSKLNEQNLKAFLDSRKDYIDQFSGAILSQESHIEEDKPQEATEHHSDLIAPWERKQPDYSSISFLPKNHQNPHRDGNQD